MRQLRIAKGLTQTELAGDRFSKEYVSQIERGKTRPTDETTEWLAARLGVDKTFLESGVSSSERERVESVIARAEAALESNQYQEAVDELAQLGTAVEAAAVPALQFRALLAESWGRMNVGEVREAIARLEVARQLAEGRLQRRRPRRGALPARRLPLQALVHRQRGRAARGGARPRGALGLPADRLRSNILGWRSRCYRRQRDWEAAREDVERALELAEGLERPPDGRAPLLPGLADRRAHGTLGARALVRRAGQGHLRGARRPSERRQAAQQPRRPQLPARQAAGGDRHLKDAYRVLLDVGSDADAGYVVSSLAQVHLRTGEPKLAEEQARHALELLGDRVDVLDEIGNAQLVLGRALLEQERLDEAEEMFKAAEASFEQLSSVSHRAAAWVAQGDLAVRRGETRHAAHLYRRAAEALQDFRF